MIWAASLGLVGVVLTIIGARCTILNAVGLMAGLAGGGHGTHTVRFSSCGPYYYSGTALFVVAVVLLAMALMRRDARPAVRPNPGTERLPADDVKPMEHV
ncbi:hypothetical protein [Tahibacter amnicola]|uniref:Sulphur transport domain-containing protein n=1 Tax=Tahibacter amnicola TaxID=2976241 RepID=A0ABY6BL08_9GAMM|nr:hypothetical protein [Tahibacter amnicola]UXI70449.1 hypothetical protein N4264_12675 [Tahibacter amnicola]